MHDQDSLVESFGGMASDCWRWTPKYASGVEIKIYTVVVGRCAWLGSRKSSLAVCGIFAAAINVSEGCYLLVAPYAMSRDLTTANNRRGR